MYIIFDRNIVIVEVAVVVVEVIVVGSSSSTASSSFQKVNEYILGVQKGIRQ